MFTVNPALAAVEVMAMKAVVGRRLLRRRRGADRDGEKTGRHRPPARPAVVVGRQHPGRTRHANGYHDVALIREELRRSRFFDIDIEARDASLLQLVTDRAMQAITSRHGEGPVTGKIRAYTIAAA